MLGEADVGLGVKILCSRSSGAGKQRSLFLFQVHSSDLWHNLLVLIDVQSTTDDTGDRLGETVVGLGVMIGTTSSASCVSCVVLAM